jgi:rhomboid family GlyGly-CTERM serine protease
LRAAARPTFGRPWPLATLFWLTLVAASAGIQTSPVVQANLEFDRQAIAAGEVWRLLTGNLVHYDWWHWAVNVGTFAALCWIGQGRARGLAWVILASGLAIGAGLYLWAGQIPTYRGISGVACALFAWALVVMAIQDGGLRAVAWLIGLLLWAGKAAYEWQTGRVLLPTSAPAGVEVLVLVHVVGLGVGLCSGIASCLLAWRARPSAR